MRTGGDGRVPEHRGQRGRLLRRHQQWPLGHCAESYGVPEAARQEADGAVRASGAGAHRAARARRRALVAATDAPVPAHEAARDGPLHPPR